jgi:hypothetical protein
MLAVYDAELPFSLANKQGVERAGLSLNSLTSIFKLRHVFLSSFQAQKWNPSGSPNSKLA